MNDIGHVRQDGCGNIYTIPGRMIKGFDRDCDDAVMAEPSEAIGLWIDIKTNYKKYMIQ